MAARSFGGRDQALGSRRAWSPSAFPAARACRPRAPSRPCRHADDWARRCRRDPCRHRRARHRACDGPARRAGRAPPARPRRRRPRPHRSAKAPRCARSRSHARGPSRRIPPNRCASAFLADSTSGQYVTVSPKGERRRGGPQPSQREKVVRRGRGRAWRRPRDRRPRVRRLRRPLGLRQEHPAAHDRRAGGHHRGRDRHRRPRRQRARPQGPGHRHGVPGLRALPAHDGVREHGVLAALSRHRPPARSAAGSTRRRASSTSSPTSRACRASSRAASASASPWAAPSCAIPRCSCSTSRSPTSTPSSGADAHRDQAPARARGHDHDLRHARPGRGDDAGRPHRHPEPRPHRADRHARGCLRPAGLDLRRGLHRRAADESAAGGRAARRRPALGRPAAGRAARAPGVACDGRRRAAARGHGERGRAAGLRHAGVARCRRHGRHRPPAAARRAPQGRGGEARADPANLHFFDRSTGLRQTM